MTWPYQMHARQKKMFREFGVMFEIQETFGNNYSSCMHLVWACMKIKESSESHWRLGDPLKMSRHPNFRL